ncbi:MAG: 2-oxoglutarate oxidoreductase [Mobilibacterium timonense]|uniref:thiamine pyrophosphate-dependent enzyme n=1 Tax=Mobilibacterium timonense TaxID=1871012 RepID=UPI002356E016|nr:thiamine pyrophosphate-dependent enzyme [Mobilibacterium timonense]MBM6990224.1 2-oxoglutarate oxidoreductase [Mobilibacterium timonense]
MKCKAPETVARLPHTFCSGCAQGIVNRLIGEIMDELGTAEKLVITTDVACGAMNVDFWSFDTIVGAHGRTLPTATGVKKVRKDCLSVAHMGDGAAYNIGMAETMHAAIRNDDVMAIVLNNCVFAMTGGQTSATTLLGQRTTSAVDGRQKGRDGSPFHVEKAFSGMDIAYLARGSVNSVPEIRKTKGYLKKAFEKQLNHEGFCLVEILTPCPTNWNMSPVDSMKRIRDEVIPIFPLGEFIDNGGDSDGKN